MADHEERIKFVEQFKTTLQAWQKTRDSAQASKLREWLNQNAHRVRGETIEANTHLILTVYPPTCNRWGCAYDARRSFRPYV